MLIFPKQRIVIFAIPKTGSTSIHHSLNKRAPIVIKGTPYGKHMSFLEYKKFLEPYATSLADGPYDYFGVMREPLDWLNSWYRYRTRIDLKQAAKSTRGMTFDSFIEDCMSDEPPQYAVERIQSSFVCDLDGHVAVNKLFRYDDLPRAVDFLSDRLEVEINLRHRNVSPRIPVENLSRDLAARFRTRFAREFDIYEALEHRPVS